MIDDETIAPVETEAVEAEPSLRESIAATMREIETRDDAPARERDETGRFKANAADDAASEVMPAAAVADPASPIDELATLQAPVEPAPTSFSAEAKAKWADTPAEVRADFARRERDVQQMVGRQDAERQFGKAINEVVGPYMPMMRAQNTHPQQVIGDLLNTAYILNTSDPMKKAQTLALIADQYGIDMDEAYKFRGQGKPINTAPPQTAEPVDIDARVDAAIAQRELKRETDAFLNDPKNEHVATVRDHMSALLAGGVATSLQDAYDQALYARPELRSTLLAAEKAKWAAQQAEITRTTQARRAAVSLPGSSGSPRPTGTHETSLRDELRNGLREMTSTA